MIVHFMFTSNTYICCICILNQPFIHIKCAKLAWTKGLTVYDCGHPSLWKPKTGPGCQYFILLKRKKSFNIASCLELVKVVRRPWAPRTFLEFSIKTGCPWSLKNVLLSLSISRRPLNRCECVLYWTVDYIKHSRIKIKCCRVIKQNNV